MTCSTRPTLTIQVLKCWLNLLRPPCRPHVLSSWIVPSLFGAAAHLAREHPFESVPSLIGWTFETRELGPPEAALRRPSSFCVCPTRRRSATKPLPNLSPPRVTLSIEPFVRPFSTGSIHRRPSANACLVTKTSEAPRRSTIGYSSTVKPVQWAILSDSKVRTW